MKTQYLVTNTENNFYLCTLDVTKERFSENISNAIKFDTLKGAETEMLLLNAFLNKPIYGVIQYHPEPTQINVDDLNGLAPDFIIITRNIEGADIIKFSADTEALLKSIPQEAITYYGINTHMIPTDRGTAIMFTAIIQYWGTKDELEAYKTELRQKNLLIK